MKQEQSIKIQKVLKEMNRIVLTLTGPELSTSEKEKLRVEYGQWDNKLDELIYTNQSEDDERYEQIDKDHLLCKKCRSYCMKFAYTTDEDYEEGKRVFKEEHNKSCWSTGFAY